MKDNFVNYEIALKLKELGFNEVCIGIYFNKDNLQYNTGLTYSNIEQSFEVCAPLYQQVFKWFREQYGVLCSIKCYGFGYYWKTDNCKFKKPMYKDWRNMQRVDNIIENQYTEEKEIVKAFESYELAEGECLKKLLEHV